MTEDDHGSARERQHGQTAGVDAPRRGPVIRTSDFVKPVRDAAPAATPGPAAPPAAPANPISERLARLARDPSDYHRAVPEPEPMVEEPQPEAPKRQREKVRHRARPVLPRRAAVTETVPAAASAVAVSAPGQPIVDAAMILGAAWRQRWVVLALMLLFAVLGGLASTQLPRKYSATTTIYFDPQQMSLDGQSATPLPQEVVMATIDSQSQILSSRRVLSAAATALHLESDREFGGTPGAMGAKIAKALTVEREDNTYVVNLTVKSKDAEKSANLANAIVTAFSADLQTAATGEFDTNSAALDGRLSDLAEQLKQAEQAVADFRARNSLETATATDPDQAKRTAALEELLLAAQSKTIAAKARADAAARFEVGDLIAGAAPAEGLATSGNTLAQLQQQYGVAAATVSNLATKLGSRHPQLVAAEATLASVSAAIKGEIARMTTAARADYERARAEEEAVARELSLQKALDTNKSGPLIEYRELRRKADAARDIYESVLKRSRQSSEEQRLVKNHIRVISPAEPALAADGPPRSILLVALTFGGMVAGLMLGLAYAVARLFITRARSAA